MAVGSDRPGLGVPYALNFQMIEEMVLRYLNFNTKEQLASFATTRRDRNEIRNT